MWVLAASAGRVENGWVSRARRGVILYGYGLDAVAEALRELDPRYVLVDRVGPGPGPESVPVVRRPTGAEANATREAAPGVDWLVVELYRPKSVAEHASDPLLALNTCKVDPGMAARAIDQPDLEIWYEIINPIRVVTAHGEPVADDYSNLRITVGDGHRILAHAVKAGAVLPECVPAGAAKVLPSSDLWALARLYGAEVCRACTARHG